MEGEAGPWGGKRLLAVPSQKTVTAGSGQLFGGDPRRVGAFVGVSAGGGAYYVHFAPGQVDNTGLALTTNFPLVHFPPYWYREVVSRGLFYSATAGTTFNLIEVFEEAP